MYNIHFEVEIYFQKYALMGLIVTSSSVSANSLNQKSQTLNLAPTNNLQQRKSDEIKPDFVPIYLYARENSLDGDYNYK